MFKWSSTNIPNGFNHISVTLPDIFATTTAPHFLSCYVGNLVGDRNITVNHVDHFENKLTSHLFTCSCIAYFNANETLSRIILQITEAAPDMRHRIPHGIAKFDLAAIL